MSEGLPGTTPLASPGNLDESFLQQKRDSVPFRSNDSPTPAPPIADQGGERKRESLPPLPPSTFPDDEEDEVQPKREPTLTDEGQQSDCLPGGIGELGIAVDTPIAVDTSVWQTPTQDGTPHRSEAKRIMDFEGKLVPTEVSEDGESKFASVPGLKSCSLRTIIQHAKSSSYEEQEFQIGRDYAAIKDLQISVAAHAKQLSLLEDDIEHLQKEIAAHKPADRAKTSAILQGFAEAENIGPIQPPTNLPHRDDSVQKILLFSNSLILVFVGVPLVLCKVLTLPVYRFSIFGEPSTSSPVDAKGQQNPHDINMQLHVHRTLVQL